MVYGRRIFHAPTKGQKSAERNDPLPLGNNFQDPVLPLEASRMGRWIWKKFLNISSVSNPFPRKGMRASGRRTWLSQTFFSRQQVDPLFRISRLREAWSRSYANFGEGKTWRAPLASGKVSPFGRVCFRPRPFHPPVSYPDFSSSFFFFFYRRIIPPTFSRSITSRYYAIDAITPSYYYDLLRFTVAE